MRVCQVCGGLHPPNFHLTLRFIGDVDDVMGAEIDAALRRVRASPFSLMLAGVGEFGGHTLWVGVEDNPGLRYLQNTVENVLQGVTTATDIRPYQPHVKLAHSRRRRSFRLFLAEHAAFRAGPTEVTRFSLIESHLGEGGARYEHLADYVLAGTDALVSFCVNDREPVAAMQRASAESGEPATTGAVPSSTSRS